jgi:hypothetical protein
MEVQGCDNKNDHEGKTKTPVVTAVMDQSKLNLHKAHDQKPRLLTCMHTLKIHTPPRQQQTTSCFPFYPGVYFHFSSIKIPLDKTP